MKKLKVMLLSFAVIAVVGGALAFKTKYSVSYCTAATVAGNPPTCPAHCPTLIESQKIVSTGTFVCTAAEPLGGCTTTTNCVASAQIAHD